MKHPMIMLFSLLFAANIIGVGMGLYVSALIPQTPTEVVSTDAEMAGLTERMAMLERDVKFLRETIAVVWVNSSRVTLSRNDYLRVAEE